MVEIDWAEEAVAWGDEALEISEEWLRFETPEALLAWLEEDD